MKRESKHLLHGLDPDQRSYQGLWLLALLYFGSLLSGAILSLIAYRLTHYLDPDASSYLASKPYPKFFDRARWVSVLFLLPYLFVKSGLARRSPAVAIGQSFFATLPKRIARWSSVNGRALGFSRPALPVFARWFLAGIAMIFLIYGFNTATGAFVFQWDSSELLSAAGEAFLAAMLIGILEEIVFRGLVFRMFYTAVRPIAAILFSSLFFAVLHFKTPEFSLGDLAPSEVGAAEAAQIAFGTAVAVFTEFDFTYLLAIFLVGVALHQVFLLGDNLWASVAIHAGWVFTIKLFGNAFTTTDQANAFSGTTRVADGYWVSCVLLLFIAYFAYRLHQRNT